MDTPPHAPLTRRLHRLEDYLFFTAAAAALGLAALSGYVLVYRAALKLWLAWTAPLTFLIAAALLLGLFWQRQALLARLPPAAPPATPAPWGLRWLLMSAGLGYAVLYLLVAGVCLRFIYINNHLAGLAFGLIYAALTAVVALAGFSVLRPQSAPPDWHALLLPGGLNLARIGAFWLGFLIPLVSMGLQSEQLARVNALFAREKPWLRVAEVPDVAVLGLGVVYFLVLEWLICQGGAAWQRLRAGEAIFGGTWGLVGRFALGAGLAYLVGGLPLLVLALLLIIQNLLASAPIERQLRRAAPNLLAQAFGAGLIYLGGALPWLGEKWHFTVPVALAPAVFFLGLAYAASQLKRHLAPADVTAVDEAGQPTADALHVLFTRTRLDNWRRIGLAAAGFALLLQLVLQILAESCQFYNSLLSPNYARCIPTGIDHMAYFTQSPLNAGLLAFDLVVVLLGVGWLLARLLRPLAGLVNRMPAPARRWLGWGLIGVTVALIAVAILLDRPSWALGALLARAFASALRG